MNHPHIHGKAFTIMFTPIRVVCMNTLMMAIASAGDRFRMPHLRPWDEDVAAEAEMTVLQAKKRMTEYKEMVEFLSSKRTTESTICEYMIKVMEPKVHSKAVNDNTPFTLALMSPSAYEATRLIYVAPGSEVRGVRGVQAKETWWGALNGLTYFIDHKTGRDRDASLANAWFGNKARMKRNALAEAINFAKAA